MITEEKLKELDAPFSAEDIEWRAQSCGVNGNREWVKCLAYVTNRAIQKRLDDVCGKANWKNEFRDHGKVVECGISILVDGQWITKWDASEETNIEAVKGGRSGAMKRSAVQWGIGRYLYELEEGWGVITPQGKHSSQTKEKQWIRWNPPALPAWALPAGETPAQPSAKTEPPATVELITDQQIENINIMFGKLGTSDNGRQQGCLQVSNNRTDKVHELTSAEAAELISMITTRLEQKDK